MEINKDLIAASSTPIVLATLVQQENYGYAILKQVQEASARQITWTDGMLYPVLHRLERLGFIEGQWKAAENGRKRKYYRITASGKTQLAEELEQWRAVEATIRGIGSTLLQSFHPAAVV
ncbi:MAG: helix-turn-helix transcriptional regulator [Patescibacteria group bacterium]|jgi:DNA-binding PadR family transcriptional regulator